MKILDGTKVSEKILEELKGKISLFSKRTPGLIFFLVGENPASQAYVRMKEKACKRLNIQSFVVKLASDTSEKKLLDLIQQANVDPKIDGILVQLPLPKQIHLDRVIFHLDPKKDVDGFHPVNLGKLLLEQEDGFIPCTPYGIATLLAESNIPVEKKHVVIVGRSHIVGKPLAALLVQKNYNATVTLTHRHTQNLKNLTSQADILIVAIGKPHFIKDTMVKKGAVVIDVGISRVEKNNKLRLIGDVDFERVAPLCSYITPVPGGVGPMTIAMLMKNTYLSFARREKARG